MCVCVFVRICGEVCACIRRGPYVFLDGNCSTVQGLLDWFEVDLGYTELLFVRICGGVCACISRGPYVLTCHTPFMDMYKYVLYSSSRTPPPLRTCCCSAKVAKSRGTWRSTCVCVFVCVYVCGCVLCP